MHAHPIVSRTAASALLLLSLTAAGCRAQAPSSDGISPELARRIALTIRSRAQLPFTYDVKVADRRPAKEPGWDEVTVLIGEDGKPSKPMTFLLSKDGQTLAQMNTFDLSKDPRTLVSDSGRPARGGPKTAPVDIVVYDDLECPFCARMHTQMFPAILNRYGDRIRVAYKDYPLQQIHPWATHAAIDANCLAAQSPTGYWNLVDTLHKDLDGIGLDPSAPATPGKPPTKTVGAALSQIDKATFDEGRRQKVNEAKLQACVQKQDDAAVKTTLAEGDALSVNGVPAIFVNGQLITGAVPIEYVYRAVDQALTAQGIAPPLPVPIPVLGDPSAAPATPAGASAQAR